MQPIQKFLAIVVCIALGTGCLTYRYQTKKPTTKGTIAATAVEIATGTLFAAVCEESDSQDGPQSCPSGAGEILATGVLIGVSFDLLGLFATWVLEDL
jgi:hypothetical protein